MQVLIVTAVAAERDAVLRALTSDAHLAGLVETGRAGAVAAHVVAGGVGPVAAAVAAGLELSRVGYGLVLSVGVAGGFAPLRPGDIAVASSVHLADLGAQDVDGSFLAAPDIGLGSTGYDVAPQCAAVFAERTGGRLGTILTLSTVTGTAARAAQLQQRFPDVVAEAMEGAAVAAAAAAHGVPFGEIRAISNMVGPRDRSAWQLPQALTALGTAVAAASAGWGTIEG